MKIKQLVMIRKLARHPLTFMTTSAAFFIPNHGIFIGFWMVAFLVAVEHFIDNTKSEMVKSERDFIDFLEKIDVSSGTIRFWDL